MPIEDKFRQKLTSMDAFDIVDTLILAGGAKHVSDESKATLYRTVRY